MDWKFIKKRLHYAWFVCFGCALIFFCTCGLSCNVFSVYLPFIMNKYNYTKTELSLFSTARTVSQMLSLVVFGRFYKKLTLRKGMTLAALINISGYFIYGISNSFFMFMLGNFFVGFGYGLSNMVPVSMMLERWFYKDRTMAVSMVSAASGLATIGVPSLITAIVEKYGLHASFLIEGTVMLVLILISFLIIRSDPSDKGMHAFGDSEAVAGSSEKAGQAGKPIITGFNRVLLYIMVLMAGAICGAGWGNMSLHASTQGYSSSVMALSITVAGAMLMFGKFLFGAMCEKINIFRSSMFFSFLIVLGTFLVILSGKSEWILYLGYGIFGGSLSMVTIGLVSWTEEWACDEERNNMKKTFQLLYTAGSLGFALLSGVMADHSGGSYVSTYELLLVFSVLIWFIVWRTFRLVRKKKEALRLS